MTPAWVGFLPASSSPLIIRSAPSQDSYWLKLGNWLLEKCAYFSSADCICRVPASGIWDGRNSESKYAPCTAPHDGEWTSCDPKPVGKTRTFGFTPASLSAAAS